MSRMLHVGNLAVGVTDETLFALFGSVGTVKSAQVVLDRASGTSRGFGHVEMRTDAEAAAARKALDLKEVQGRCITVSEARPKTSSPGRGRTR